MSQSCDREKLAHGVWMIAWGYVLLHVNINLGALDILPNWLGYIFMLSVLPTLGEAEPAALLLRPLAISLAIWEGLIGVLTLLGVDMGMNLLEVIVLVISLYFHFQLLTNLSEIAKTCECHEQNRILILRTVKTLLITFWTLSLVWKLHEILVILITVVHIIVAIWICFVLFSFRSSLLDKTEL